MRRPVCLVTGATGTLGPAVVQALRPTYAIRTFTRRPPPAGLFVEPIEAYTGDIADRAAVGRAAEGARAIVHLAALLHIVNPRSELHQEYERVNVEGTAAVVDAALSAGVSRLVLTSTIAVYGRQPGAVIDETTPPRPDSHYGETKLEAERVALGARDFDGEPLSTVLRAAAVYGSRVKGNYRALLDGMARRRFVPVGRGENRRTILFEDDLAAAIALAVGHPAAAGRIYNVSDGTFHTMRDIIEAIAGALGRRSPTWSLPVGPVRLAVAAAGLVDRRLPRMLDKYLEDIAVDASRIHAELGFRPQFDLSRGWAMTVDRMRQTAPMDRRW